MPCGANSQCVFADDAEDNDVAQCVDVGRDGASLRRVRGQVVVIEIKLAAGESFRNQPLVLGIAQAVVDFGLAHVLLPQVDTPPAPQPPAAPRPPVASKPPFAQPPNAYPSDDGPVVMETRAPSSGQVDGASGKADGSSGRVDGDAAVPQQPNTGGATFARATTMPATSFEEPVQAAPGLDSFNTFLLAVSSDATVLTLADHRKAALLREHLADMAGVGEAILHVQLQYKSPLASSEGENSARSDETERSVDDVPSVDSASTLVFAFANVVLLFVCFHLHN